LRPFVAEGQILESLLAADVVIATQRVENEWLPCPIKLSLLRYLDQPLLWVGPHNPLVDAGAAAGKAASFAPD